MLYQKIKKFLIISLFALLPAIGLAQEEGELDDTSTATVNDADATDDTTDSDDSGFYGTLGYSPRWFKGGEPAMTYKLGHQVNLGVGKIFSDKFKVEVEALGSRTTVNSSSLKLMDLAVMLNAYATTSLTDTIAAYGGAGIGAARQTFSSNSRNDGVKAGTASIMLAAQGKVGVTYAITDKIQVYGGGRVLGLFDIKGGSNTPSDETKQNIKDILNNRNTKISSLKSIKSATVDSEVKDALNNNQDLKAYLNSIYDKGYTTSDVNVAPHTNLDDYSNYPRISKDANTARQLGVYLNNISHDNENNVVNANCWINRINNPHDGKLAGALPEFLAAEQEALTYYNAELTAKDDKSSKPPLYSFGPEIGIIIRLG